jgi:hypothetical protein
VVGGLLDGRKDHGLLKAVQPLPAPEAALDSAADVVGDVAVEGAQHLGVAGDAGWPDGGPVRVAGAACRRPWANAAASCWRACSEAWSMRTWSSSSPVSCSWPVRIARRQARMIRVTNEPMWPLLRSNR